MINNNIGIGVYTMINWFSFGGFVIKLNYTQTCDSCEEDKFPDYECGDSFTCKECREVEGLHLEDMGASF